ncbi:MAG: hypothetical protein KAS32_13615 [Candidatus Peribacteraceae bacterium]|nr:hypothetical protein [Candidatus Peribacteraceae bacterium]
MGKRTNKIKVTDGILESVMDVITSGLQGTVAEFTFCFNETTNTEAAAAFCKTYDLSATEYQNVATSGTGAGYAANYQLFPDTEQINDAVYFGAATPFGCIYTNVAATIATYSADGITWEYWDGNAWATLTIIYDQTDSDDQDGDRPFQEDGYTIFSAPSNWKSCAVDSQTAYWIRARLSAASLTQIPLLDSVEHYTVAFDAATKVPYACTIGRGKFNFGTVSGANADAKVILVNLSKGTCSAITTITKAKKDFEIADFAVTCDKDDEIGFFITQEDGTTEYANGLVELTLTRTA